MKIENQRYTILDGLPKYKFSNKEYIDWSKTVGYNVPFSFDEVSGIIQIIGYRKESAKNNRHRSILSIVIDKYVPKPIEVRSDFISNCQLYNLVKNRIINLAPHLIQYLVDPTDAYKYSYQSNQKIHTRCPICGHEDWNYVNVMYKNGFFCPECSDTSKIPNKLMFSILTQLNIPFVREVNKNHFSWMQKYLYDFYININGSPIIIEMDGGFHNLQSQQEVDKIKTKLVLDNGFKLIRINCDYVNVDPLLYIKNNILKSDLSKFINVEDIDWDLCREYIMANISKEACDMWEKGCTISDIMDKYQISKTTVRKYLIRGKLLGLCSSYNKQESRNRSGIQRSKPVAWMLNDTIKYVFVNTRCAAEQSLRICGTQCSRSGIYAVCDEKQTHTHNLIFKYITKEQYEQYKMIIEENYEVVRGDCNNVKYKKNSI